MSKNSDSFNWRVVDQIEKRIHLSGMTDAEVIKRSGMRRNTFYVKMRGETALTTDDIAKIADALNCDPVLILTDIAAPHIDVTPSQHTEDLHTVDLQSDFGLAATHDNTGIDPSRGES